MYVYKLHVHVYPQTHRGKSQANKISLNPQSIGPLVCELIHAPNLPQALGDCCLPAGSASPDFSLSFMVCSVSQTLNKTIHFREHRQLVIPKGRSTLERNDQSSDNCKRSGLNHQTCQEATMKTDCTGVAGGHGTDCLTPVGVDGKTHKRGHVCPPCHHTGFRERHTTAVPILVVILELCYY